MIRISRWPEAETVVMFGGDDHSGHARILEDPAPLIGVKFAGIEQGRVFSAVAPFLVGEGVQSRGIESVSVMVHLPQYVQLEEDYAGANSLMDVICTVYDLPKDLSDPERGLRQYRDINNEVQRNQGLKALIERLEVHYDSRTSDSSSGEEGASKLSPEVEKFLREMGERFES